MPFADAICQGPVLQVMPVRAKLDLNRPVIRWMFVLALPILKLAIDKMIEGLSHITFVVRDLDRMEVMLATILGAQRVYDSGAKPFSVAQERYFLAGEEPHRIWIAIMQGESMPSRTYNHVAFKISESNYDECLQRVVSLGLSVREGRPRVDGEGRSIYFHDDDNHLFELHTGTLKERLERYESRTASEPDRKRSE